MITFPTNHDVATQDFSKEKRLYKKIRVEYVPPTCRRAWGYRHGPVASPLSVDTMLETRSSTPNETKG